MKPCTSLCEIFHGHLSMRSESLYMGHPSLLRTWDCRSNLRHIYQLAMATQTSNVMVMKINERGYCSGLTSCYHTYFTFCISMFQNSKLKALLSVGFDHKVPKLYCCSWKEGGRHAYFFLEGFNILAIITQGGFKSDAVSCILPNMFFWLDKFQWWSVMHCSIYT